VGNISAPFTLLNSLDSVYIVKTLWCPSNFQSGSPGVLSMLQTCKLRNSRDLEISFSSDLKCPSLLCISILQDKKFGVPSVLKILFNFYLLLKNRQLVFET